MDWQTILTVIGIIAFIVIMMRGCGGMMSGGCGMGGCGMGSRRKQEPEEKPAKQPLKSPEPGDKEKPSWRT